uniref:PP12100 n=1 Tax=Homo sapiens TaxID=9606 RepID=Q71RD0_HUMAN|nr:PP12100 [Homo sapiens]
MSQALGPKPSVVPATPICFPSHKLSSQATLPLHYSPSAKPHLVWPGLPQGPWPLWLASLSSPLLSQRPVAAPVLPLPRPLMASHCSCSKTHVLHCHLESSQHCLLVQTHLLHLSISLTGLPSVP